MKKLLLSVLVVASLILSNEAGAQGTRYYYYPGSNVYYDPGHNQYIYYNGSSWTTVNRLPSTVTVDKTKRVAVYSNGTEVWKENQQHKVKYDNYPNGKAVGYKGTNPNRTQGKAVGYKGTNPNRTQGKAEGYKGTNTHKANGKTRNK